MNGKPQSGSYLLLSGVILLYVLLFVYPVLHTIKLSFVDGDGPGIGNYISFLTEHDGLEVIGLTTGLAVGAAFFSALLSVLLLFLIPRTGPLRTAVVSVVLLPVIVPGLIFALGLLLLWDEVGWVNLFLTRAGLTSGPITVNFTPHGLILFYTWLYFPFTALVVFSRWQSIPKDTIEAARVCGAGRRSVLKRVVLPLLWPGIITGASMSFLLSFGAFSVPLICGGDYTPLAVEIYRSSVVFGDWGRGAAAAVLMAASQVLILSVFLTKKGGIWKS